MTPFTCLRLILSAIAVLFLAAACFLQKIGENTEHILQGLTTLISGSLGLGYAQATEPVGTSLPVDEVWAVPLVLARGTMKTDATFGEYSGSTFVPYYLTYPLAKDLSGRSNFAVAVEELRNQLIGGNSFDGDWLLVLVNSVKVGSVGLDSIPMDTFPDVLANRKDALVSFIGINRGTALAEPDALIRFPVQNIINQSLIDLGPVNKSSDGSEAVSTKTLADVQSKITLTTNVMQELASMDAVFKGIKNNFINFVDVGTHFRWNGSAHYGSLTSTASRSPEELLYDGSQLTFNYRTDQWPEFIQADTTLELEVPGEVLHNPMGGYVPAQNPDTYVIFQAGQRINLLAVDGAPDRLIYEGRIMNNFPAGWFRLYRNSTQLYGYYDLVLFKPFWDNGTDKPLVYIPVLTFTTQTVQYDINTTME